MKPRLAACLALLAALFGCAPQFRPAGPAVMRPALERDYWRPADGTLLPLRAWLPEGTPKAVVMALHGMNDYANAFDTPGRALAAHGIAVYAYDQRGFGRGPHPGKWAGSAAMADDAATFARLLAARYPGTRLFVLGESMGGAVALVAAPALPPQVAGLILSAPAVWGRDSMATFQTLALALARRIAPGWTLTGKGLGIRPSDNLEMLRALARDPLVLKATRIDTIAGLVDLMGEAAVAMDRLALPALVLVGAHDEVIPAGPTWTTIRRLPRLGLDQRAALYESGWHMLLRDLQAATVVEDVAAWIEAPGSKLPSGAAARAQARLDGL